MRATRRNRGSAFKIFLIVLIAVVVLVVACVWGFMRFGVPRIAAGILSGVTGETVAIGKVGVYPIRGSAHLRGIEIGDKFGLQSMDVQLDRAASGPDGVVVEFLKIAGIEGKVTRHPDGTLDLPIAEEFTRGMPEAPEPPEPEGVPEPAPPEPVEAETPPITVNLIEVAGGPFTFIDQMVGGLATEITTLNLTVTELSTLLPPEGEDGANINLTAMLGPGDLGTLTVTGVTDKPAGGNLDADIKAAGLDIAHFGPYIPSTSPVLPSSGKLNIGANIRMNGTIVDMIARFHAYGLTLEARDPALQAAVAAVLKKQPGQEELSFDVHIKGDLADPTFDLRERLREAIVKEIRDIILAEASVGSEEIRNALEKEMRDLSPATQDLIHKMLGE